MEATPPQRLSIESICRSLPTRWKGAVARHEGTRVQIVIDPNLVSNHKFIIDKHAFLLLLLLLLLYALSCISCLVALPRIALLFVCRGRRSVGWAKEREFQRALPFRYAHEWHWGISSDFVVGTGQNALPRDIDETEWIVTFVQDFIFCFIVSHIFILQQLCPCIKQQQQINKRKHKLLVYARIFDLSTSLRV